MALLMALLEPPFFQPRLSNTRYQLALSGLAYNIVYVKILSSPFFKERCS